MATLSLYIAVQEQVTTYPLINRTRRQLNFFSASTPEGYITPEMMLPNTVQTYDAPVDISSKHLKLPAFRSDIFTVGGAAWAAAYSSSSLYDKLYLHTHLSAPLSLPLPGGALTYSTAGYKSLLFIGYVSARSLVIPTSAQVITYESAISKNRLIWPEHIALGIALAGTGLILDYLDVNIKKLKFCSNTVSVSNHIDLPTNTFSLNYGGDNTFYSLNGFFNYFRYRHQNLMATIYHILIGPKIINMYTTDMVCIESHRAGYKSINVSADFLKDETGNWLSKNDLKHLFYEDRFVFYDYKTGTLYMYDFDSITLSSLTYFNIDSTLKPIAVSLFLDPTYKMPYIMPVSSEGAQLLTSSGEYWNFIQINNIKNLTQCETIEEAADTYIHDVFSPTNLFIDNMLFRYKNGFILEGYKGQVERVLYYLDIDSPSDISTIFSYSGSKALYAEYPIIYFSMYTTEFQEGTPYGKLAKLNLETMDIDITKLDHFNYQIIKDVYVWHMYKKASNESYYLYREDDPDKKHNLTIRLSLDSDDILEFMVFNSYEIYILTSSRKIFTFNTQTMQVAQLTTFGTPLLFIKFNSSLGCVLTRSGTKMYFEELQPILWSHNPDDWITPYDMRKGERLLPYTLLSKALHKRTAPIKTVHNCIIAERISNKQIAMERGVVNEQRSLHSDSLISVVKVGRFSHTVYGNSQYVNISPIIVEGGLTGYAKDIDVTASMNIDDTFTLSIADLGIPETLTKGFKIYEK